MTVLNHSYLSLLNFLPCADDDTTGGHVGRYVNYKQPTPDLVYFAAVIGRKQRLLCRRLCGQRKFRTSLY